MVPHNQFEVPQCLSEGIPFQDGELAYLRDTIYRGDHMMKIDLRRLSYHTNCQASQEIPMLSMARQELPVQDSPVRPGYSSSYLHQASRPCSNRAQESGPSSDNLSGRYFADGIISRHSEEPVSDAHAITAGAGVHIKPQEMCLAANKFLGFLVSSNTLSISLPEDKILKVQKQCRRILNARKASARELAQLIGLLTSLDPAMMHTPLFY